MQSEKKMISAIHYRLSQICVGASSLRNQGGPGFVQTSREYFFNEIGLPIFFKSLSTKRKFDNFLNKHTSKLEKKLPGGGHNKKWGSARKGLNLFFRELVYNKILCDYYKMPTATEKYHKMIAHLEVPLDKDVAIGIRRDHKNELELSSWPGIVHLTQEISQEFQQSAQYIAQKKNIPRIHLDLIYWRPKEEL